MRRALFLIGWAVVATGCAEIPVRETPEFDPDYVIERSDDLGARPEWLSESTPFLIEDGTVTALGETEIPATHRLSAAYRIAENNASAEIAGAIQRKLHFIFQNAEEGTALDAAQVRFIGGEASSLVTSSLQTGRRYWEKVGYSNDAGKRLLKYRVWATVEMPESDFREAIVDAIRRTTGKTGLSEDFAAKVNEHWEELTQTPQVIQTSAEAAGIADLPEPPAEDADAPEGAEAADAAPPAPEAPETTVLDASSPEPPAEETQAL